MGDFDDRGGADDAEAEGFGDAELEAGGVGGGEVEVEEEGAVAGWAEEGEGEGVEGGGEVGGDWVEVRAERLEQRIEGVHCGFWSAVGNLFDIFQALGEMDRFRTFPWNQRCIDDV